MWAALWAVAKKESRDYIHVPGLSASVYSSDIFWLDLSTLAEFGTYLDAPVVSGTRVA